MKKVIFKYDIEITDLQTIEVNEGAKVISAREQRKDVLTIWTLTDLDALKRKKNIQVIGTGNPIEYNVSYHDWDFVDTVIMSNGLVIHVFADKL